MAENVHLGFGRNGLEMLLNGLLKDGVTADAALQTLTILRNEIFSQENKTRAIALGVPSLWRTRICGEMAVLGIRDLLI